MAKRRGRKKKIKNRFSLSLKKKTILSVLAVLLAVLAAITVFSYLQEGYLLTLLNVILLRYFSYASFFVPFFLISLSLFFSRIKGPFKNPNILIGFSLFWVSFLGLFRQGLVGNFLWSEVVYLITAVGAALVYLGGLLVGVVVLFDTSLADLLRFLEKILLIIKKYSIGLKKPKMKKEKTPQQETIFIQDEKTRAQEASTSPVSPPSTSTLVSPITLESPRLGSQQIWQYPPLSLLSLSSGDKADRGDVKKNATTIEDTLESFGITAKVSEVNDSPSVTQYALKVALGTKLSKITGLSNDLALALAAPTGQIRIEAPIPGRSLVGVEVPNRSSETVTLRQILESDTMKKQTSKTIVPLGLSVSGEPIITDITRMPHVLIAGQTGSGKSVCINSWISTLLFRASPEELRFIMVDPKRVELTPFNGIPHLLNPVIVEPDKVISSLKWAIAEMDKRYKRFAEVGARNIEHYNEIAGIQSLPYIFIVIDELADIMLFAPAEVEDSICRLAQMARATGIHLILATQRPSVDVITGLVKANIPARIAFAVSSITDSRVILDTPGAEKLLGKGDMLFIPPEQAKPSRIQGAFVSLSETSKLIEFLKKQKNPDYEEGVTEQPISAPGTASNTMLVNGEERDELFDDALQLVVSTGKASASLLQRRLKLGYARAARVLDQLEKAGIVGPSEGAKPREILASRPSITPSRPEP